MHVRRLLAFVAIAAIVAVPAAQAHSGNGNGWVTVASGLDNPRGIALGSHGDLWISEAGKGGTAPCFPGDEGGSACFGNTGAFTLVHKGVQKRVVSGLPSIGDEGTGDSATGAADIIVNGKHITGVIGSGGTPEQRASLSPASDLFGWVVKINPWTGTVWPFADVLQYEADHDPDGTGIIDSDAYGLTQTKGGFIVADAGGNDVLGVNYHRHISTLGVFPSTPVEFPPGSGTMVPMEAVPTATAVRPHDPNIYVGQLTGFPFPPGAASVWRIKPDGTTDMYATGFTNITDIAWGKHGALYVVEIAQNGLLSPDQTGAIVKVWPNGKKEVVASTGLTNPTAIAIAKDGTVYVTNHGASAGIGEVLNIGKV
jgi:hypothetical protein